MVKGFGGLGVMNEVKVCIWVKLGDIFIINVFCYILNYFGFKI